MYTYLKRICIILCLVGSIAFVSFGYTTDLAPVVRPLTGSGGSAYIWGTFNRLLGNAGRIDFGKAPVSSYTTGAKAINNTLTGYFWIQTTGWNRFENVELNPKDIVNEGVTKLWTLSGKIWSNQAGWTYLNKAPNGTTFTGVTFDPLNIAFSGYAWNPGIGWIDMSAMKMDINAGFIGKVKIIGSLGGNKAFDTLYSIGPSFQSTRITSLINTVRKNVAIITRNMSASNINTNFITTGPKIFDQKMIFQNNDSNTTPYVVYDDVIRSSVENSSVPLRSIIVIGGSIYLNKDVFPADTTHPIAIIALANSAGNGGTIYIHGSVKKINASLIAEKSIQSATFFNGNPNPYVYNLNQVSVEYLPPTQLYIHGSLLSNNTIGGGIKQQSKFVCPYFSITCDGNSSLQYDFNYFRNYTGTDVSKQAIPGYDAYSMIIDYDARILSDPPPGLSNIQP